MMATRSGRIRQSISEASPPRSRKGVSPTRSPARNRKKSPTRSFQKSPSRKSPNRKLTPKYPARKSPSRSVKENKEIKEAALIPRSPSKRAAIKKEVEVRLEDVSTKMDLRNTRSRRIEYSVSDLSSTIPKTDIKESDTRSLIQEINGINELETVQSFSDIYSLRNRMTLEVPRRSSRLKDTVDNVPDIRRSITKSLSKSVSKSISKSLEAYSDEEDFDELMVKESKSKSQSVSRTLATPLPSSLLSNLSDRFEFCGRVGVVPLYVLIPLTVFYILLTCSRTCSYISLKELSLYKTISIWLNMKLIMLIISNFILQAIFLSMPVLGTKDIDNQDRKYYFNAIFACFCTLNIVLISDYYGMLKIEMLLNSFVQMATASYMVAVLLAAIAYWISFKTDKNDLNPYGSSGYRIYDFFIGRNIQAIFMKINMKLLLSRVSNSTTLILSIFIFKHSFYLENKEINNYTFEELKAVLYKVHLKPTILVYSGMQLIYILYFIMKERKIIHTFYWHSEGLGYLQFVSSCLYPFYFTTISKYVKDTDLQMTYNTLIVASILFLLGFLLMLISNNIKYEFRKNPLQPHLMYLDSMPTFHGNKLIVSNLWGVVRHPNYAGDILIHISLALPGIISKQVIPAAPALLTILVLLHRCWRDHHRCRRRYGAAWLRYCKRVPSVIIPKIL